jgi:hypothetical protein
MNRSSIHFLISILAVVALVKLAGAADQQTVWTADPKTEASLQDAQSFGGYSVRLPTGYSLLTTREFKDTNQWEWHGNKHDDGTRPVIEIWIMKLDADEAGGDVIGLGEKLLESASQIGTSDYTRGKDQKGIDSGTGNWVTRFPSNCTLKSSGTDVPIVAQNYLWLDKGQLLIAIAYDETSYSKESLKDAEAAILSVHR